MHRDSGVFYRSFYEAGNELPGDSQGIFYTLLIRYMMDGEYEPSGDKVANAMFIMARPQIDANNKKFENGQKGAEHGSKGKDFGKLGGRPPKEPSENPPQSKKITPQKPPKNPPNVNDNVNDIGIIYKEDIFFNEVKEFIDIQSKNITGVKYQIDEKGDEYYKKQYEEYSKLLTEAAKKNLTREHVQAILKYIPEDSFRRGNIGSIIKLRSKNRDGVPYRVVMIGKIQKDLQGQKQVFNY